VRRGDGADRSTLVATMSAGYEPDCDAEMDALYTAWTIIANANEGNWDRATPEWRAAAERWRDEMFHPLLAAHAEQGSS
jgi:hypothetical protein